MKEQRVASRACDCFIGTLPGDFVKKSTLDFQIASKHNFQNQLKSMNMLKGQPLTPKQLADSRRGYLTRFKYGPFCGEKINWKQLISF